MWCDGEGCGVMEEGVVCWRKEWCDGGRSGVMEEGVVRWRKEWCDEGIVVKRYLCFTG